MDDLQNSINTNSTSGPENAINPQNDSSIINPIGGNNNDMNSSISEDRSDNTDNSQLSDSSAFDMGNTPSSVSESVDPSSGNVGEQSINVEDHFNVAENTAGINNNPDFNSESNSSFDSSQPENHQGDNREGISSGSNIVNQTSTAFNIGENNIGNNLASSPSNPNEALDSNVPQRPLSDTVNPTQPVSVSNDPDINKPKVVTMAIVVCFLILIGLLILYFSIF